MSVQQKVEKWLPAVNKSLAKNGSARNTLLSAFNLAGLPFDNSNFPVISIDGNANNVLDAFSNDTGFPTRVIQEESIFGTQVSEIKIHPQVLIDRSRQDGIADLDARQFSRFVFIIAIESILSATSLDVSNEYAEIILKYVNDLIMAKH